MRMHSIVRSRRHLLLLACFGLASCAVKPSLTRLDPTPRQATDPQQVQVYAQAPERPHRVIAVWKDAEAGMGPARERMQEQATRAAAQLGADAMILRSHTDVQMRTVAEPGLSTSTATQLSTRLEARFIVWEPQPGR